MIRSKRALSFLALTLLTSGWLAACSAHKDEGPGQRAGQKVDKGIEKLGEKMQDAGEKMQDAAN